LYPIIHIQTANLDHVEEGEFHNAQVAHQLAAATTAAATGDRQHMLLLLVVVLLLVELRKLGGMVELRRVLLVWGAEARGGRIVHEVVRKVGRLWQRHTAGRRILLIDIVDCWKVAKFADENSFRFN